MRKWLTAFLLVAAMLGGAVGIGAHEGEGSMASRIVGAQTDALRSGSMSTESRHAIR